MAAVGRAGKQVSYYYEQEPGQARQPGVTPATGETIIGRDKNWLGKCLKNSNPIAVKKQ
jgi:hypothetical protein